MIPWAQEISTPVHVCCTWCGKKRRDLDLENVQNEIVRKPFEIIVKVSRDL
jgi:hypothetical protein